MRMDTLKRTTLFPLIVLTISLLAIYVKESGSRRSVVRSTAPSVAGRIDRSAALPTVDRRSSELESTSPRRSTPARPIGAERFASDSRSRTSEAEVDNAATLDQAVSDHVDALAASEAGPSLVPPVTADVSTISESSGLWTDPIAAFSEMADRATSDGIVASDASIAVAETNAAAAAISELRSLVAMRRVRPTSLSDDYRASFAARLEAAQGLARKGALFSADRAIGDLLLDLARTLDGIGPVRDHERACRIGLDAMRDATDFHRSCGAGDDPTRLALVARRHATFVAMTEGREPVDRIAALEAYYALALEMLVAGSGRQPMAAEAFVTLGKIHSIAGTVDAENLGPFSDEMPVPKSLLYHQVALVLDGTNPVAANELAVQLGRLGHWRAAKELLLTSLRSRPSVEAWHNLAETHERLGEPAFAQLARTEEATLRGGAGRLIPAIDPSRLAIGGTPAPAARPVPRTAESPRGVPFFGPVR